MADLRAQVARLQARLPASDCEVARLRALLEANEERVIWGTDWPHPNKYEVNPNDADPVEAFGLWVPAEGIRQQSMVTNSEAFYRFYVP